MMVNHLALLLIAMVILHSGVVEASKAIKMSFSGLRRRWADATHGTATAANDAVPIV